MDMSYEPLHPDETKDGLLFGLMLASNPRIKERREAFYAAMAADRKVLAQLPRETLERAITERRLWTLPGIFDRKTVDDMIAAIASCMQGKDRSKWLSALGICGEPT